MTTRTSMRVAMAGKKGRTRVGVWLRTAMDGSGITATDEGTALGAVPFGVEDVPPVFGGVTGFTTLTAFDFFIMGLLLMRRDCRIFWRSHRHGRGVQLHYDREWSEQVGRFSQRRDLGQVLLVGSSSPCLPRLSHEHAPVGAVGRRGFGTGWQPLDDR